MLVSKTTPTRSNVAEQPLQQYQGQMVADNVAADPAIMGRRGEFGGVGADQYNGATAGLSRRARANAIASVGWRPDDASHEPWQCEMR